MSATADEKYLNERLSDDYFEEMCSDDNDDELSEEHFREEARFWAEEAEEHFRRYRTALKSGEEGIANQYYDEAKCCRKNMKAANDTAAEIAFERHNKSWTLDIIDLHNLFVSEAIAKLTDRFNAVIWTNIRELTVIVGRGHHSECGPKLKTAVIDFAVKNNITYCFDSLNPGRIVLQVEGASKIRAQNESDHLDSSMYIYNRTNEVTLSEYITKHQRKKQCSKNKKKTKQRADDRPNEVKPNVKESQSVKQNKGKCNAQKVTDCPNDMEPSINHYEIQQKDSTISTHVPQNEFEKHSSLNTPESQHKDSTHISQNGSNVSGRFDSLLSYSCYALIIIIVIIIITFLITFLMEF